MTTLDNQEIRMAEIAKEKRDILRKIAKDNVNLLEDSSTIQSLLEQLRDLNAEQKKTRKERHKVQRQKYEQTDRAKELSRVRSKRTYERRKKKLEEFKKEYKSKAQIK